MYWTQKNFVNLARRNFNTWEAKAGGTGPQSQSWLQREFPANWGYTVGLYLKQLKIKKKKRLLTTDIVAQKKTIINFQG